MKVMPDSRSLLRAFGIFIRSLSGRCCSLLRLMIIRSDAFRPRGIFAAISLRQFGHRCLVWRDVCGVVALRLARALFLLRFLLFPILFVRGCEVSLHDFEGLGSLVHSVHEAVDQGAILVRGGKEVCGLDGYTGRWLQTQRPSAGGFRWRAEAVRRRGRCGV